MKILNLISDIDINRNLALQKVTQFHAGYQVIENDLNAVGTEGVTTYISVIFNKNRDKYARFDGLPDTLLGGTGWDINSKLPPEIDAIKPRINFGFTSRGCNRTCSFCIVPAKEGRFHVTGDLFDIWDGTPKASITLWDNNILLDAQHFQKICDQAREHNLAVDWNQGLDFRLFTSETVEALRKVRRTDKLRFALDDPAMIDLFREKLELIRKVESTPFVYVYCDGMDWNGTLERLDFLRKNRCKAYLQRDDCIRGDENYTVLAEWVNGINGHFWKMDFETFYNSNMKRRNRTMNTNNAHMRNIQMDKIIIGNNRRTVGDVSALVDSIRTLGLTNPIQITKEHILIAGQHRLEACKRLGWTEIPAMVVDYTKEQAELAEIDENLIRNELSALERSEQIDRRKHLYEILFPNATKSAKSKANLSGTPSEVASFSNDTAEKAKCTARAVQYDVQIATKLTREIRDEIRDMPIAKNQSELLALARTKPEEQRAVLDMMQLGLVKKVGEAISLQRRNEIDARPVDKEPVEGEDFVFSASIQLGRYEDVVRSYPDASVELVLTDPPYNTDVASWDRNFNPLPMLEEISRILTPNGSALVFCNDVLLPTYLTNTAGMKIKQVLHWFKENKKPAPLDGKTGINKYLDAVEYIVWYVNDLDDYTFNPKKIDAEIAGNSKTALLTTGQCGGHERLSGNTNINGKTKALHKCQKPYELIESLLLTHSNRGDTVVDLFLGTGTVAEVAIRWERCFHGCEMDPKFHDISVKRAMSVLGSYKEPIADEWDDAYENNEVIREFDWSEVDEVRFQAEMERMRGELLAGRLPSWVGNGIADMEKAVVNG